MAAGKSTRTEPSSSATATFPGRAGHVGHPVARRWTRRLSRALGDKNWDGVVDFFRHPAAAIMSQLRFRRKASADTASASHASIRELWEILQPERRRIQLALLSLAASATITLSLPRLMGLLVDSFKNESLQPGGVSLDIAGAGFSFAKDHTELIIVALLWGACASGIRLFLIESASERIAFHLRLRLFKSLIHKKTVNI